MSITGPHGVVPALSNIQAVGNQTWMGNDSYSASGTIAGANDGDTKGVTRGVRGVRTNPPCDS